MSCCGRFHEQQAITVVCVPAVTSSRFLLNVPLAAVVVGAICLLWTEAGEGAVNASKALGMNGWRHRRDASGGAAWQPLPTAKQDSTRWRDKVRAPVVEQAWETLCGSILQEVSLPQHEPYDHPQIDSAQSALWV